MVQTLEPKTRQVSPVNGHGTSRASLVISADGMDARAPDWIARELHDGVLQNLIYLSLELSSLATQSSQQSLATRDQLRLLERVAAESAQELRGLLGTVRRPPEPVCSLQELVTGRVESFEAKTRGAIRVQLQVSQDPISVAAAVGHQISMIVDEALCNAWRHAEPENIKVLVRVLRNAAIVSIADDGRGFDLSSSPEGHYGLQIMQERARALGGELNVTSRPGHGTTVSLYLPGPVH